MMGLSDGRKSFPIGLAVLIQYRSVTATQPATQPPSHPASHVAVAITLNAKASSLKIGFLAFHRGVKTNAFSESSIFTRVPPNYVIFRTVTYFRYVLYMWIITYVHYTNHKNTIPFCPELPLHRSTRNLSADVLGHFQLCVFHIS